MLFYDTCALLELDIETINTTDELYISSVTLEELEDIKTSRFKDEETKAKARKISKLIRQHPEKFNIALYDEELEKLIISNKWPITPDIKIVITAHFLQKRGKIDTFVTLDNNCATYAIALGLKTLYPKIKESIYTGYKEITLNDEELADFYQNIYGLNWNKFNLMQNQYILIRDEKENKIIDQYIWNKGYK